MARETEGEVLFFGVAWQTSPEEIRRYVEEFEVPYDVAHDANESVFDLYGVPYQPATAFITTDGRVMDMHFGGISAEDLRARVEALMEA